MPANGTRDTVCGSFPIKLNEDGFPDQAAAAAAMLSTASATDAKMKTNVGAIVGPIVAVVALLLLAVLWRRGVLKQAHAIPPTATLSNFSDQRAGYLNPRYEAAGALGATGRRPTGLLASVTTTNVMYDNGQEFVVPNSPTLVGSGVYMDADAVPGSAFRFDGAISNATYDTVAGGGGGGGGGGGPDRDAGVFSNPTYSAVSPDNPSAAIHAAMSTQHAGLGLRRHSSEAAYDTAAELEAIQSQATGGGHGITPEATYYDRNEVFGVGGEGGREGGREDSYLAIGGSGESSATYSVAVAHDENVYDAAASGDQADGAYAVIGGGGGGGGGGGVYDVVGAGVGGGEVGGGAAVEYSVVQPGVESLCASAAGGGGGGGGEGMYESTGTL